MLLRPAPVKGEMEILMPEGQEQKKKDAPLHKCPRCDSLNTKFCYFNNYNRSQPRHFCRACRRYWTEGGTLRNVPVGGSHRNKRRKTIPIADSSIVVAAGNTVPAISSAAPGELQVAIFRDELDQVLLQLHSPAPLKLPSVYTADRLFDASLPHASLTFMEDFMAAASSCSSSSHYSSRGQDFARRFDDSILGTMDASAASTCVEETVLPASYWEFWDDAASLNDWRRAG